MIRRPIVVGLCLVLAAVGCRGRVRADASAFAADSNDATVIISGCGNQPVVGYTYCRVTEGQDASQLSITLHSPPGIVCKTKPCAYFTVFQPDGSPAIKLNADATSGQTALSWIVLVKRQTFQKDDRGFWPVLMEWKYLDMNGDEHSAVAEGEIRLRVLTRGYVPLQEAVADPNFAWTWVYHGLTMGMTTSGRATVHP